MIIFILCTCHLFSNKMKLKGVSKIMKKYSLLIISVLALLLAACSSDATSSLKTADIIKVFKDDGLEIGETSELEKKEFGNTREEGIRILIPSLGEDAGGRLFKFKNKKDLEKAKSYYDELGKEAPMFYSHTHANGNFLLQMNGDMKDQDFEKYTSSLDKALK